ncbi:MAG: helix-turn-helix domain-containing protein [Bacteroidota bacterium]|nr:helix-turn-helix domain-containing protein [Bacteroidota bacterium]
MNQFCTIEQVTEAVKIALAQSQNIKQEPKGLKLSQKELAKRLGLTEATIINLKKRGLPSYKNGHVLFYFENEVLEFLKDKRNGKSKQTN